MARMHDQKALKVARISRTLRGAGEHGWILLGAWNYATAGDVLRTDDEHDRCRRVARAIERRCVRWGVRWEETESGQRMPA